MPIPTAAQRCARATDAYWANRKPQASDEPWAGKLLGVHDSKLRRCWFCGEWAYDTDPCGGCHAAVAREVWAVA